MKKILCILALILTVVCVLTSCAKRKTPEIAISDDGYWVINGKKTDTKAQGEKGEKGDSTSATNENPLGLAFFLKDDGTYIVEIGQAKYLSKIEIPATYNGKAVTEVRNFKSEMLKEVTIPDSVTSIDNYAFDSCTSLTSVIFANPNGWWRAGSANATSGTAISASKLSNTATAAEYLKSTYYDYYWFRTEQ